jgi:hypothetical protein
MAIDIERGPIPAATISAKSTAERSYNAYNPYGRRVTVLDAGARRTFFGSFRRVFKGWRGVNLELALSTRRDAARPLVSGARSRCAF